MGAVPQSGGTYEVQLEGNFWPTVRDGRNWYDVPFKIMVPKRGTGSNLLVPVALSASAVAYSSTRIENMFMSVGSAAGVAAKQLVDGSVSTVQDVDVGAVQKILTRRFNQRIHGPPGHGPTPSPPAPTLHSADADATHINKLNSTVSEATRAGPGRNGLAKTPPMGWMSWEIFRCQTNCSSHPNACIDHNLYEQMTDRLVEDGYLSAGYNQVSIDDCWEDRAGRNATGHLVPDPKRFPDGMQVLGDFMHSRGVLFGFYSALGSKTCGGFPGTGGHITRDMDTFAAWGIDYLKLDACVKHHSELAGYSIAGSALQATGRNITYSCSWPACLGSDESKKPFGAFIDAGCNLWRNWIPDIQCSWHSLSSIIDHWGYYGELLQPWAGPGHWPDMDMLLIGNDCVTIDEQRTQMAIWSISASPLIMGNDLRQVSNESKEILLNRDAIAVNQDPLGRMGIRHPRYPSNSSTQVWYRELVGGMWPWPSTTKRHLVRVMLTSPFVCMRSALTWTIRYLFTTFGRNNLLVTPRVITLPGQSLSMAQHFCAFQSIFLYSFILPES